MLAGFRGVMKDGIITQQAETLPRDLLHGPEPGKGFTFKKASQNLDCTSLPKRMTRSSHAARSHSTTSIRKTSEWLAHRPHVQLLIDEESKDISAATQRVLDRENYFNQSFDEYLKQTEEQELRRKEMQHKCWTESIANPIQKSIQTYIDGQSSRDIERRRRLVHAQYLKYCNKKGCAFMDDYDPLEYNPLSHQLSKQYLRVCTAPLRDPLSQQSQKRYEEERIALHCETGRLYCAKEIHELNLQKLKLVPLGRHTMNGIEWVKTPHGYIESEIRQKSRQRMRGTFNKGSHNLNNWAPTENLPGISNVETQLCHKLTFPKKTAPLPGLLPT
ncbi:protein FAM228B [Rhinophrynus dorsalis]